MSHALYRLGRFAATRPWVVIGTWVLVSVLVIGASATFGRELEGESGVPGLDSQLAVDLLTEAQSDRAGLTSQLVITPQDPDRSFFDSPDAVTALSRTQTGAGALPKVLNTSDPAGALAVGRDNAVESGGISPDGQVALIRLQYPVLGELGPEDLENLKEYVAEARAASPSLQIEMGGDLFFEFEEPPAGLGEAIGLGAAVIILLFAFGSLIAMGLPIGMALFGLALGISSMSLITYLVEIPSWAPVLGSMIGLGVGIDYALFLVTRHREHLSRGMTVAESAGRAVATAGQAVIFAGGTVVIAILGLAIAGIPFMTAAGIAVSVIVLIMVVASVTLLPAFLGLAGHWINRLGIHRRTSIPQRVGSGWERWGAHVSGNAGKYAIGVTALLLGLTAPVLALQLGLPDDGSLPESNSRRQAYDLVADGFGPGVNGPLVIAVDISQDATIVDPLVDAIANDQGIAAVTPAEVNTIAGVATIIAIPTTSPQDAATFETVQRLRSDVFPQVLDGSAAKAHVGGATATVADLADRVTNRLPLFIAAVIVLSFILLMLLFRSILVPLKAAILNLLSIGASYGVLVMVFQWGWGASLIGLESTVPIISFIPMFMFAILFGLSMDYEVFLLSRVREEYLITRDNDASVIHGIASTARVITSAALIMISVFLAFVLGDDPAIKMFGLGLATAIFVDATIVRMVLVPATMKLMGDANWWIPGWLDRILPTIDIEGEAGLPAPEMEVPATTDKAVDDPHPERGDHRTLVNVP